ncbi:hypothetical protein BC829DRAFT_401809 [Chytridium lagenaria]|nr:hypothetical protein BC829DRAFT_401809 [Chytridium lagenaria]
MHLEYLDISKNSLSGNLPSRIGGSRLHTLRASENKFEGGIPAGWGELKGLITLELASNKLGGLLPESLSRCVLLDRLDVSDNAFQGQIPAAFRKLKKLTTLNIHRNNFSGILPEFVYALEDV